jgi:prepilin-type N-terminal cleavage/methylation domain-containing protein
VKKLLDLFKRLLGKSSSEKGFTLIELLIVIAVLGVLAGGILIAIDPIEQLARGRDSGRKSSVTQLGRAIQAYYASRGQFPGDPTINTWDNDLESSGEVKNFPEAPTTVGTLACTGGNIFNRYCYKANANNFVVYTPVESDSEISKNANCTANAAWYTYASNLGRAGLVCGTEPPAGFQGTMY